MPERKEPRLASQSQLQEIHFLWHRSGRDAAGERQSRLTGTAAPGGEPRAGKLMIPLCNDDGYLPPGIHPANLEEIATRFGRESELRQVQMQSLRWLVDLARRAGVERIVVNGSFVTDKLEPNDVDCVLLIGPGFPRDPAAEAELLAGLPFISLELVDLEAFRQFTESTFATDRNLVPKGMVEVSP